VWSVRGGASQAVMTCRTIAEERVGDGYDALVDGHRKAVNDIASAISAGVRSLGSAPAGSSGLSSSKQAAPAILPCPPSGGATTARAQ